MKKIIKKLGVALAFVPMFALIVGGFTSSPVAAADCNITGGIQSGIDCGKTEGNPDNLFGDGGVFNTIVNVMLFIVGVLSVVMLIYAGIRYVTSRGESSIVTSAKNTIMYAIIGLVVSIFAYAIVNWVVFAATNTN